MRKPQLLIYSHALKIFIYLRAQYLHKMKKISSILSITALVTASVCYTSCNSASSSSSNFEGVVAYEIKAGAGLPPEVTTMLQTMNLKTFVKGTSSRTEESMAGNSNIVIADSKKPDDRIMLIFMLGHKYALRPSDSMKRLEAANIPKIEYIDSANATKQIAGYSCKKARLTMNMPKEGTVTSEVYYTTDLPYADPQGQFKGLKGMPMEYSMSMGGMNITISAKTVDKKTLSDSLFTIPSDYKEVTIEELQKQLASSMPPAGDTASGMAK